jgi:LysM repeat protein
MARIARLFAMIVLTATLAGCFRQAEESFENVTLEAPATSSGPTSLPINTIAPTNTVPLLVTVAASSTPDALTSVTETAVDVTDTPAQTFITPGSPLNTMVVITETPTLGTPVSATPGGLITPTDAFNVDTAGGNLCEYEVKSGDTLFRIAVNNDTTVEAIREASDLTGDSIFPGDILIIPDCGEETTADSTDAPDGFATALPDGWQLHIVNSGEVLGSIAERYGVRQSAIIEANNLQNPNSLSVGQELLIPAPE